MPPNTVDFEYQPIFSYVQDYVIDTDCISGSEPGMNDKCK